MRTFRKWMSLILIAALCFTLTFTSASADDAAVMDARNGVVRIVFAYEDSQYTYVSQGSGFCVGIEGEPVQFIITNAHVITATDVDGEILGYAREVTIVFDDYNADSTVKAKVLKVFTNGVDLAVLKLEAPTTLRKPLPLRSAQEMEIMDTVHALGFPAIADDSSGYAPSKTEDVTITSGKVTKMQYLDGDTKFMQVDAAISSGNSGGPLVDQNGAVIGINTQVNDPSHGTGLGYALYIDYAMDYFDTLGYPYSLAQSSADAGNSSNSDVIGDETIKKNDSPAWYVYVAIGVAIAAVAAVVYLVLERKKKQAVDAGAMVGTIPAPKPMPSGRGGRQITSIGQTNVLGGKTFPIHGKIVIGRDPASAQIVFPPKTPGISAKHCLVQDLAQGAVVTDLGSTYGTYLENGTRLEVNQPYTILTGEAFFLATKDNGFRVK